MIDSIPMKTTHTLLTLNLQKHGELYFSDCLMERPSNTGNGIEFRRHGFKADTSEKCLDGIIANIKKLGIG